MLQHITAKLLGNLDLPLNALNVFVLSYILDTCRINSALIEEIFLFIVYHQISLSDLLSDNLQIEV